jgi:hypothetical protein
MLGLNGLYTALEPNSLRPAAGYPILVVCLWISVCDLAFIMSVVGGMQFNFNTLIQLRPISKAVTLMQTACWPIERWSEIKISFNLCDFTFPICIKLIQFPSLPP